MKWERVLRVADSLSGRGGGQSCIMARNICGISGIYGEDAMNYDRDFGRIAAQEITRRLSAPLGILSHFEAGSARWAAHWEAEYTNFLKIFAECATRLRRGLRDFKSVIIDESPASFVC